MKKKNSRVTFDLPVAMGKKLRAYAKSLNISVSDVLRGMVNAKLMPPKGYDWCPDDD